MKTFKEILQKPSAAVTAMIDGLLKADKRPDFIIDMGSFGHRTDKFCYGCAAVCEVQEATGVNFTPDMDFDPKLYKRSRILNVDSHDLNVFESAIDDFRSGYVKRLFDYFDELDPDDNYQDWNIGTSNWKSDLPKVIEYRDYLISIGL